MYADELTEAMENAIKETNRRRQIQDEYNKQHGIVPKTIVKAIRDDIKVDLKAIFNKARDKVGESTIDKDEGLGAYRRARASYYVPCTLGYRQW